MRQPFDEAVARHGAVVARVCRAVLGPGADADDAWSETFLAALRAWPDLDDDTHVEAWLVRVAHNKAIDVTRARRRHAVPTGTVPEHRSTIGQPEGTTEPCEPGDALRRAVAALPERQRLAVAYHYFVGLAHKETAALIGGSVEAVRRSAADGIRSLRASLGPTLSPPRRDEGPAGSDRDA